ncbi:MAG: 4Fe-4S binding protein [Rhodobacterales bacterium]|nr:4Fe-4S binding protein [Rhodobacterales bacterium]
MVTIEFQAEVIPAACTGCKKCVWVCPTEAIHMEDNIAIINKARCVSCQNCHGICPDDAIFKEERAEPLVLGVDYKSVDQDQIAEICRNSNIHPMQWLCLCTATRCREGAAAILQGAKTPEDIALMTGVRSGCTVYCTMMSLRLLKGAGIEVVKPPKWRWYDTTQTLWEFPEELKETYEGYFLDEDKDVFRKF